MATTNDPSNLNDTAKQEEEIKTLRDHFKDNIRILSSIGQFSYILKIRAEQYDVSLTLQLDRAYPSKIPDILITAPRLTPEQIALVQQHLQIYSESLLNRPMILQIYTRLLQWFDENNIQTLSVNKTNLTPSLPSTPRSPTYARFVSPFAFLHNQNRLCPNDSSEHEQILPCSTSKFIDEILTRLQGDDRFDKRLIRVGYLDRTLGLQEKVFQDCEFPSDATTTTIQPERSISKTFIPKYSIQYFKYGNDLIWDKDRKTDFISGPTGNQQMLEDIINRQKHLLETINPSLNSHSDPFVNVDHPVPMKRFLPVHETPSKANYFLSIPITDPSLIKNYFSYREHLLSTYSACLSSSPSLSSTHSLASSSSPHLHLILLTLRLSSIVQLDQCIQALKRIQEEIHYHCSYPERISLEFRGLDTFFGKTVYIKCQSNTRLENLRTLIIERLCEQQQKQKINDLLVVGNHQEFIPHLILFKTKRKLSLLPQHESPEIFFGQQTIDALHLSSFENQGNDSSTSHCVFKLDLS